MAEVVHHNLEKYVDILASLKDLEVLSKDQVKSVVNKIRELEYSLLNPKNRNAFNNYIHYMTNLIDLIDLKKTTNKLKLKEIRVRLVSQTQRRFKKVIFKHQGDKNLWNSYIKFLSRNHLDKEVGKTYMRMLQVHPGEAKVWIKAGHHFWKTERSFDKSRNTFQLGIRHLPNCLQLWEEYFKMELRYSGFVNSRKDALTGVLDKDEFKYSSDVEFPSDPDDPILKGKLAVIVFEQALKQFSDPSILPKFLAVLKEYKHEIRKDVEEQIIDLVKKNYPDSPAIDQEMKVEN